MGLFSEYEKVTSLLSSRSLTHTVLASTRLALIMGNDCCCNQKSNAAVVPIAQGYGPPEGYERIDEFLVDRYAAYLAQNVFHQSLNGEGLVEEYKLYKKKKEGGAAKGEGGQDVIAYCKLGADVCGHPAIVHGGITALLLDQTFGWLFVSSGLPLAVTASLTINYKAKISAPGVVIVKAKIDKLESRKMYFSAEVYDEGGAVLYATASSLFVSLKVPWCVNAAQKCSFCLPLYSNCSKNATPSKRKIKRHEVPIAINSS